MEKVLYIACLLEETRPLFFVFTGAVVSNQNSVEQLVVDQSQNVSSLENDGMPT